MLLTSLDGAEQLCLTGTFVSETMLQWEKNVVMVRMVHIVLVIMCSIGLQVMHVSEIGR